MVKLSVYNEKLGEKEVKKLKFRLMTEDGILKLVTVDDDGAVDWYVLDVKSDGTFERCESLPDNIGLQVDEKGRIKETK